MELQLRKARNSDVPQIRSLINGMAARTDEDYKHGHMLARSLTELYEHIRDYTVLVEEVGGVERVVGCCALESQWSGLAELKAMAIDDSVQGHGWGRHIVESVVAECEDLGIDCVYLLTNKMEFFARLGFEPIDMRELPMRVWKECTNCPKYDVACDEVAMTYGGKHPRPLRIPAVGAQASPAARASLGVLPVLNNLNSNGQHNGHSNGAGGLMNSDGYSPPFRPHPEE